MAVTAPRITIKLPDNVPADAVWVRYALYGREGGRISRGDTLEPTASHFEIFAVVGAAPAQEARVVLYAPGCQFAVFDINIDGDVVGQFRCEALPTKTVHGYLDPKKIPSNTFSADKKLDIDGYFTADWVCGLFLQPRRGANIGGGSCLGSGMRLGTIGQIDPAEGGKFNITIPDFTRDPVFHKTGGFGVIQLSLNERKLGRPLATIKAADSPELGLNVQIEYPDPVVFTRIRW